MQPRDSVPGEDRLLREMRLEIERLHRFFQDWFTGAIPDEDTAFAPVVTALGPDFEIVPPDGRRQPRDELLTGLRAAWGSRRGDPAFAIRVEDVRLRRVTDALLLGTYEEWQEDGAGLRGRLSLVAFERGPAGLSWLHVHEVALPGRGEVSAGE